MWAVWTAVLAACWSLGIFERPPKGSKAKTLGVARQYPWFVRAAIRVAGGIGPAGVRGRLVRLDRRLAARIHGRVSGDLDLRVGPAHSALVREQPGTLEQAADAGRPGAADRRMRAARGH